MAHYLQSQQLKYDHIQSLDAMGSEDTIRLRFISHSQPETSQRLNNKSSKLHQKYFNSISDSYTDAEGSWLFCAASAKWSKPR